MSFFHLQINKTINTDKKFIQELKDLKLKENEYLISKKNGEKLKPSSFGEKVINLSIDKLGEAKIFKIVIKYLLDKKDFNRIEELVNTRGTSMATILKSYNVYSNNDKSSDNKVKQIKEEIKQEWLYQNVSKCLKIFIFFLQ